LSFGSLILALAGSLPRFFSASTIAQALGSHMQLVLTLCLAMASVGAILVFRRHKRKLTLVLGLNLLALVLKNNLPAPTAESSLWALGLDWLFLDTLFKAIIFMPLEFLRSGRKSEPSFDAVSHAELRLNIIYFVIAHLFAEVIFKLIQQPAFSLQEVFPATLLGWGAFELSIPLQFVLAVFVADAAQYWVHRAFHEFDLLWRFHAVHHSTKLMNWLAGTRQHIFDVILSRGIAFMALYFLGLDTLAYKMYIGFVAAQAVFAHSDIRLNLGILRYLIVTPQYHHWHHTADEKRLNLNYAIHLPVIDYLFGTMYMPKRSEWPGQVGLSQEGSIAGTYFWQTINPFLPGKWQRGL